MKSATTITAISTAPVLGELLLSACQEQEPYSIAAPFSGHGGSPVQLAEQAANTIVYGGITDSANEVVDDVLLSVFRALLVYGRGCDRNCLSWFGVYSATHIAVVDRAGLCVGTTGRVYATCFSEWQNGSFTG